MTDRQSQLKDLERRLAEANANERWWTTDEADKWAGAIFGPKATFTDWGELTAAFSSLDAAVSLTERVLLLIAGRLSYQSFQPTGNPSPTHRRRNGHERDH